MAEAIYQYFIALGIDNSFIKEKEIKNLETAKEIVEEYNWQELLGRELEQGEKKAILQQVLINKMLNKHERGDLKTFSEKLKQKGLSHQEVYAVIINSAIRGLSSKQETYTRLVNTSTKIDGLELTKFDKTISESTILKARAESLTAEQKERLKQQLIELEIGIEFIEKKDIRNVYIAKQIVEGYHWQKYLGRDLTREEKKEIICLILDRECLKQGGTQLSGLILKLHEKKNLTLIQIYAVVMNLAINSKISEQAGYTYSHMLFGNVDFEQLTLRGCDTTVTKYPKEKTSQETETILREMSVLGVSPELIEGRNIKNLCIALEIVNSFNWQECLDRDLTREEKKEIIELILKPARLEYYLLKQLMEHLKGKGLNNQEIYAVIINLAINRSVSGIFYEKLVTSRECREKLQLRDADKNVSKVTIARVNKKDEDVIVNELISLGIPKGFIEEKDTRNLCAASKIVNSFNWQDVLGREIDKEEKRAIIMELLKNNILNKNNSLNTLIFKLEQEELTEQEIYAIIINLGIRGSASNISYTEILNANEFKHIEWAENAKTVTENAIIKAKAENLTNDKEESIEKELVELGIPKELIEKKDIRNIYVAKEIVEGYNWQELLGRELEPEEKKVILLLILNQAGLNSTRYQLSTLILNLEDKELNCQEVYAVIINLATNGKISQKGYSYSRMINGEAPIEKLELENTDKAISELTIAKAKEKAEKIMKYAVKQQKSNVSEIPNPEELTSGLGIGPETLQEETIQAE